LEDVGVVVVVVVVTPPQFGKFASLPPNHVPFRRTSAWNLQLGVAGTLTVRVPVVPESVPTSVPLDQRLSVHVVPGWLLLPITKMDEVGVSVGCLAPAKAKVPTPSTPTTTAPMHTRSRFILLLLARRSQFALF
jgi:hypothetical protein